MPTFQPAPPAIAAIARPSPPRPLHRHSQRPIAQDTQPHPPISSLAGNSAQAIAASDHPQRLDSYTRGHLPSSTLNVMSVDAATDISEATAEPVPEALYAIY